MYIDLSSPCSGTPFRQRGTDGGAGGRPVALLSSSATPCDMSRSVVSLLVHQSDNVNVTSSVNASRASDTVDGDVVSPPVPTASMPSTRVVQPSRSLIISPTKRQTDGGALMALSDANEPSVTNSPRAALMPERDVVSLFPSDAQTPTSILSRATPASPPRPAPASSSRSAHSAACDLSRSIGHLSDNITFSIGAECAWDGVAGVVPPPHPLPALARPSTSVSLSSSSPRQRVGALSPQCVSSRSPLAVSSSFESQVCGALAPSCDMSQPSPSYGEATSAVANSISSASASCAAFDTYLAALLHVWVGRAECVVLENFDLSLEAATRFTAALPFVSAESLSAPARASAGAGDFFVETALIHAIAQRFDCQAMPTGGTDGAALVALVLHLARSLAAGASFRLVCGCSVDYDSARRRPACHCLSIIGAATSLCETLWLPPPLSTSLRLMCGEWSAASIAECYRTHPRCSLVVAELASFVWPIVSNDELDRLLSLPNAAPTVLIGCEYSAALRSSCERHGFIALSVDLRDTEVPGLHARMGLEAVWDREWDDAIFHPPCTHLALSDRIPSSYMAKRADGRTWWGLAFFVKCYCVKARRLAVEQPDTIIPDLLHQPSQRLLPSFVGDNDRKPINLFTRGRQSVPLSSSERGDSHHLEPWEFQDSDARDRWRSDWRRFPRLCDALVTAPDARGEPAPRFEDIIEDVAAAFHDRGWPLPPQYALPLPPTLEEQLYQRRRGRGDGRRVVGVVPLQRQSEDSRLSDRLPLLDEWCDFNSLTQCGLALVFVAICHVPLVYAALDGVRVIGAEFDDTFSRSSAVRAAGEWASVVSTALSSVVFLAGEFRDGPRVAVAPLRHVPHLNAVVSTPSQRRSLAASGYTAAWCTLAALAGCVALHAATQAVAAVASLGPHTALLVAERLCPAAGLFRTGSMAPTFISDVPLDMRRGRTTLDVALARDELFSRQLVQHLRDSSLHDADLDGWDTQIKPAPIGEVPAGLLQHLPDISDARLDHLSFSASYQPQSTQPLARMPPQRSLHPEYCPTSPLELLLPGARFRLVKWLNMTLADLVCIRDYGDECERHRPRSIAIGQSDLVIPARGIIWDFTQVAQHPKRCAVPLDFDADFDSTLNRDYLRRRLHSYPDQRLVSMLTEGVRYLAEVELQTVLVPHLLTLSKAYGSVDKELRRLHALGWYSFFADLPYFPMYLNGQGCVARKLEPDRWRRTTEGGGPRQPVYDSSGLRAWSLNDASREYHLPQWIARLASSDPQWAQWADARHLLPTSVPGTLPKLGREIKPTPDMVMRDLSILLRAGRVLREPVYLFGDDAKDYFNHFANAAEELWKMGTVFLGRDIDLLDELANEASAPDRPASETTASPAYQDEDGNHLLFVSERRMGFGLTPNSNIAQQFSEVVNDLLREDFDATDAAYLQNDQRPEALAWKRARAAIREAADQDQQRLYFVHMYTDDNIIGVVGAARAVRLLKTWRQLTTDLGLKMAIPEKRTAGTWALWLGILFFATLGVVAVPRAKLLRASASLRRAAQGELDFSQYRSLVGLLEHLRAVGRLPKRVMWGLYEPHRRDGLGHLGPSSLIVPNDYMREQLRLWLDFLSTCAGAPVTSALRRAHLPLLAPRSPLDAIHLAFDMYADAATDSAIPSLGGYMHGYYWHFPLERDDLLWMHIGVLELLATAFNALIFAPLLPPRDGMAVLRSDALNTPLVLAADAAKRPAMRITHAAILAQPAYVAASANLLVAHIFGDSNPMADAISRAEWARFAALCRASSIKPTKLEVPSSCRQLFRQVLQALRQRGVHLQPTCYRPVAPPLPVKRRRLLSANEKGLDAAHSSNTKGDGPGKKMGLAHKFKSRASSASAPMEPARFTPATLYSVTATSTLPPSHRPPATSLPVPASSSHVAEARLLLPRVPAGYRPAQQSLRQTALLALCYDKARRSLPSNCTPSQLEDAAQHFAAADDMAEFGAAAASLHKEDTAWAHWTAFCSATNTDPILWPLTAQLQADVVAARLSLFVLWVYPRLQGRRQSDAHPRSAFAHALSIRRTFVRRGVPMPKAKAIEGTTKGLLRSYKLAYGEAAVAPQRKEPMLRSMWQRVESLAEGHPLPGRQPWSPRSSHVDRVVLRLGRVLWRTGHRLGEIVTDGSSEPTYLTRANVTLRLRNRALVDPSPEQWRQAGRGDSILLAPCASKTDQFGLEHCPFPSVLPFDNSATSAAASIRDIELETPCRGSARRQVPLFATETGRPFIYSTLHGALRQLLTALFGARVASTISWHSIRIGLACALLRAGCPPAIIQLICRWASEQSLRVYARIGTNLHIEWTDKAAQANVDAVQVGNLPRLDNSTEYAALLNGNLSDAPLPRSRPVAASAGLAARRVSATATVRRTPALPQNQLAPLPRPRSTRFAVGDYAMVPRAVYPTYTCREYEGTGWEVRIERRRGDSALVTFTRATRANGGGYVPVWLQLRALQPLP